MSNTTRSQYAIDLNEIERQIREASSTTARGGEKVDPLAELARIVETSPVFRNESNAAPPPAPAPKPRVEATLPPIPRAQQNVAAPQAATRAGTVFQPRAGHDRAASSDLESAMRSLDHLLKHELPKISEGPKLDHRPPADDPYADWILRPAAVAPEAPPQPVEQSRAAIDPSRIAQAPNGPEIVDLHDHEDPRLWASPPPEAAEPEREQREEELSPAPRRRPVILAAAVLGVAVLGVGGALSMRGAGGKSAGAPPTILADTSPSKIAPANPGGITVPDQNIQILQRSPASPPSRATVVNSEEQPMDLREALRRSAANGQGSRAVETPPVTVISSAPPPAPPQPLPAPPPQTAAAPAPPPETPLAPAPSPPPASTASSAPAASPPPPAAIPEPRRVKTVVIKPPDPPPPPEPEPARPVAAATPAPAPTPATPAEPPAPARPAAAPPTETASIPTRPQPAAPPRETAAPAPSRPPRAAARATAPANIEEAVRAPLQIAPPERVASIERSPLAATTPPAPPAPEPAAEASSPLAGGFVVQLSSEGSDQEARAVIGRLQGRYGELSSLSPSVQRREVGGKMRYRVRFGAMSREQAATLCRTLKGKGQDCIIQVN